MKLAEKLKRPRSPKTIAAMLLAGFLAFAPPGTLIACAALVIALFGYCTGGKKDAAPPTQQAVQTEGQQPQQPRPTPSLTPMPSPSPTPTPSPTAPR